jgi:hypothetical protein
LCYDPDKDEYPLPVSMWSTVKDMIFTKDFRTMLSEPSDVTNDSQDNIQNAYNLNLYRPRRQ